MTTTEQILNDGAKQFAVLTGENLLAYARTFAALAQQHLEQQASEEAKRLDDRSLGPRVQQLHPMTAEEAVISIQSNIRRLYGLGI